MTDGLSEEQERILEDAASQWQQEDRHSVLSQEEMNTLLSAYESANAPGRSAGGSRRRERQVRLYDFAKPDRFSKEHLRALHSMHEGFAAELSSELTALYAATTRADLISIDQVTYKQYRAAIPSKTLLAEVSISSMSTGVFFAVNSSIVGVWVDYLCGGNPNIPATPSDLTPLDVAVAKKVIEHIVPMYAKIWPGAASADVRVERAAEAEVTDETLGASETVLVCNYEVQAGASVGMMTICIPASGVEQMMPAVSAAQSSASVSKRRELKPGATAKALDPVQLPCHVVLGTATASLADLADCEVGDVLRLNKRAGDEAELWIGSRHVFDCRPGIQRGNVAIVISGLAHADASPPQAETKDAAVQAVPAVFPGVEDATVSPSAGFDESLPAAA